MTRSQILQQFQEQRARQDRELGEAFAVLEQLEPRLEFWVLRAALEEIEAAFTHRLAPSAPAPMAALRA